MKKNTKNQKNNNLLDTVLKELRPEEVQNTIVLAEILGKPVSKRRNRSRVGRGL